MYKRQPCHAAVVFQCTHGCHQHCRIRMQACHPAFDIKELLCAQIGTEACLCDGDICHFQCHLCRLYTVAAVCNIGEGAAVDKRRRMLQCLDHIWL